jgi:hypothetical protein
LISRIALLRPFPARSGSLIGQVSNQRGISNRLEMGHSADRRRQIHPGSILEMMGTEDGRSSASPVRYGAAKPPARG